MTPFPPVSIAVVSSNGAAAKELRALLRFLSIAADTSEDNRVEPDGPVLPFAADVSPSGNGLRLTMGGVVTDVGEETNAAVADAVVALDTHDWYPELDCLTYAGRTAAGAT